VKNVHGLIRRRRNFRCLSCGVLATVVAVLTVCNNPQAYAGLTINATFDSSITSLPDAAAIEGAINAAINVLEKDIANPITVSIDFQNMSGGLGQSDSGVNQVSYFDYYNKLAAQMTTPAQMAALASLGPAPTSESSPNPVNGSAFMEISSPQGRMLGFNTPASVPGPGGTYDTIISLNTSITSPPNGLPGHYGLQAVANHELDEALGIGGLGSFLGSNFAGVGSMDLYRYSAPGVRSFTTDPHATAYFSMDGGVTNLVNFNQAGNGSDYGDWATGSHPQVQDAFGTPGANPALGPNELAAFSAVGYTLTAQSVPEPSSLAMLGTAILVVSGYGCVRRKQRACVAA
jgi:hypothetical protein